MSEELRKELILLMDSISELAYGVMLTVGQDTATKVIVETNKVKSLLKVEGAKN